MPKDKRRKRNDGTPLRTGGGGHDQRQITPKDIDTSKPSAVFTPTPGGRPWTLSIALPGSIVANAKNHDSKTYLAGTIARALAVFCVDEIVIFDDGEEGPEAAHPLKDDDSTTYTAFSHPSHFLAHVLSFLETPAQLRKQLFPMHPNLKTAGTLPSLDMPHHLRPNEWCDYREGITVGVDGSGTWVDVGLDRQKVVPDAEIPDGTRVTVKLTQGEEEAEAVSPAEPRESAGYYWGYSVRPCHSLSAVFTECPFEGGYDVSVGTSERGTPLNQAFNPKPDDGDDKTSKIEFAHLLLVLGGVAGLETAAANDPELMSMGLGKANIGELFDYWVNVLPGQGSRTIRTEEAVWLGLMGTRALIDQR